MWNVLKSELLKLHRCQIFLVGLAALALCPLVQYGSQLIMAAEYRNPNYDFPALFENVVWGNTQIFLPNSFMQYKIPTRLDVGRLKVEFEHSYEPTGPFCAKSIGEIVINTPAPAIAHAIYRATGVWHRELPITPEQIAMSAGKPL